MPAHTCKYPIEATNVTFYLFASGQRTPLVCGLQSGCTQPFLSKNFLHHDGFLMYRPFLTLGKSESITERASRPRLFYYLQNVEYSIRKARVAGYFAKLVHHHTTRLSRTGLRYRFTTRYTYYYVRTRTAFFPLRRPCMLMECRKEQIT